MALFGSGFGKLLVGVLKEVRPDIAERLDQVEAVGSLSTFERAQRLLNRKPGRDFWKTINILFMTKQGRLADQLLRNYEAIGEDDIPSETRLLWQQYRLGEGIITHPTDESTSQNQIQPQASTSQTQPQPEQSEPEQSQTQNQIQPQSQQEQPQPQNPVQPELQPQNEPQPQQLQPQNQIQPECQPQNEPQSQQTQPCSQIQPEQSQPENQNQPQHSPPKKMLVHVQNEQVAENGPNVLNADAPGDTHNQTEYGNPLSQDAFSETGQANLNNEGTVPGSPSFEQTHSGHQNATVQNHAGPVENPVPASTTYSAWKASRPEKVYSMDRNPRGQLLIINNERFDSNRFDNRTGTQQDGDKLRQLFQDFLHFDVQVAANLTAQGMLERLNSFAENPELGNVDSLAVAILSHGGGGDIIFGCDGEVTAEGRPVDGTYISRNDLRRIFSTMGCAAMQQKPKLFIIQACRGRYEDTSSGPRVYRRDVVQDSNLSDSSNFADQCFMHATVENYVAYRNMFIQLLVKVFREHAESTDVKNLATELSNEMSQIRIPTENADEHIFTISEDCSTLIKRWFLNP